jgi:hypothetical protein
VLEHHQHVGLLRIPEHTRGTAGVERVGAR